MTLVRRSTADDAVEPVALSDLKAFSRVVSDVEDRVLEQLLMAARTEVERHCGHVLVPGTFDVLLDEWTPQVPLVTPLRSVVEVKYHRFDGSEHVVDPTTYFADLDHVPGRLAFLGWSSRPWGLRAAAGVVVTVTAGYEKPSDVPADIRQTVMTAALLMYEHRDDPDVLNKVRDVIARACTSFSVEPA